MDERDGETSSTTSASQGGGGTSLPRPKTKRPTIIRPASKVSPAEPPPRPSSRPNNVINSNNSQKAEGGLPGKKKPEITVIDAKPMTELGIRERNSSTSNVPASLPARNSESTGGMSIESTQLRSHPEDGQVSLQDAERVQDNEHNSRISQKPSAPPKSAKPTIIRAGSKVQSVAGENKPLPAPPPRPAAIPKSDPSLRKSTSVQGPQISPQQQLEAQFSLLESSNTTSTNNPSPTQSPVLHQAPKRPPRLPSSGLHGRKTATSVLEPDPKPGVESEIKLLPKETPLKNMSQDEESPKTVQALPKPKPMPKPRPVSVRSPGFKADITSEDNVNKDVNTKTSHPDLFSPSHDTQEEIRSRMSQCSGVTNDEKTGQNQRLSLAPVPLRKPPRLTESTHKPETVSTIAVSEKTVEQDSTTDVGRRNSPQEQLPAVHKPPPAVPAMSHTSGTKPSPIVPRKPDTSSRTSSHIDHQPASSSTQKMPPARPATSAPPRGKSIDIGEINSPVSDSISSSSNVKKVDTRRPSHPADSRSQNLAASESQNPAASRSQNPVASRSQNPVASESQNLAASRSQNPVASESQNPAASRSQNPVASRSQNPAASESQNPAASRSQNHAASRSQNPAAARSQNPAAARSQKTSAGLPPVPKRPGPGHPLYHYMSGQPHGIAKHDYTATQPDELSFSKGDTVILVKEIDDQWMIGRAGDNEGMFPAAFLDIRCSLNKEKPNSAIVGMDSWSVSDSKGQKPDILTGPRCKARFDFEGDGEGELALEDGDVVQITERVGTEWLRGQHRGRQGIFPSSFVEIVEDLPPDSSTDRHMLSNVVSALFDFDGKDGELIFKTGDQIMVLGEVNSEWLFGTCHGQEGQFPASFVSHVPPDLPQHKPGHSAHKPKQTPQSEQAKKHQDSPVPGDEFWESREDVLGFCRAMFDYLDPTPGDLEFKKGDRIEIVEFVGEDWARGRLGRKEGMFPLRFVAEEVNSPPRTPEPEVVKKVFGKVLHNFDGETPDDLMIKEGDIIEVEDFADVNKHWRWGVVDGKRGMFPAEFVEILE